MGVVTVTSTIPLYVLYCFINPLHTSRSISTRLFFESRLINAEVLGKESDINSFKTFCFMSFDIVGFDIKLFKSSESSKVSIKEEISPKRISRLSFSTP